MLVNTIKLASKLHALDQLDAVIEFSENRTGENFLKVCTKIGLLG